MNGMHRKHRGGGSTQKSGNEVGRSPSEPEIEEILLVYYILLPIVLALDPYNIFGQGAKAFGDPIS
jgi:hypothetical protein